MRKPGCRWLIVCVCSSLALLASMAAEPEDSLVGAWVNQADANATLEFFGNGIGENAQYFACTFPASDQVTLNYGDGNSETYTVAFVGADVHLRYSIAVVIPQPQTAVQITTRLAGEGGPRESPCVPAADPRIQRF